MKILMIIPAYNEEKSIKDVVQGINNFQRLNLDYIVINDGSTDLTEKVLVDNNINHITLPYNMGIGAAVQTGYKYAYYKEYDIAIQFDGDGQHDIEYIDKMIQPIVKEEADMVIGSRYIEEISTFKSTALRQVGITMISFFIKILTRKRVKDVTSGYRAVNKKIIELFSKEYPQEYPEPITNYAILRSYYRVKEVGVNMHQRKNGNSSINSVKSIYYMFNVFVSILFFDFRMYRGEK